MSGCGAAAFGRGGEPERPKIVVLNVKGGKAVRGDIVNLLQAEYPLVPRKRYVRTARSLKATKLRARHITKVSAELGVSAVVSGRVKRRGKRRYLYVTVYDGASGVKIERFRVRLTRKRTLTKKGSAQLEGKLMAALSEVKPAARDEGRHASASDDDDGDDGDDADEPAKSKKLSKRERRRQAREERKRKREEARERKRAEREAKKQAAAEKRAKAKREREERAEAKRREREKKKREAKLIKKVVNPETNDEGQALDDEAPPGL